MLQFHMLSDADAAPEKWQGTALSALLGGADYPADRLSCGCTVIAMYDSTLPAGLLCVSGDTTDSTPVCGIVETVVLLPEYRRQGVARTLESFLIDRELEQGNLPYCQVFRDNAASLALQRKLGLQLAEGLVIWLRKAGN